MAESIVSAAREGLTREVQWFLAHGEDVNVTDAEGRTALHWAIKKGDADCVVTLLRAGADLDLKDNEGNAPIHVAVRQNQLPLVRLLIKAGADLRILDGRSLNCYNLARGLLGSQSEVTKFLAEIMEKVSPGSTGEKVTAPSKPTDKETPVQPAGSIQRQPAAPRSVSITALSDSRPSVAAFHPHFLVIVYAGISLAVVELSDDLTESLAFLRAKLEEDEVPIRFPYSFVFQATGALVTKKQEARFLVSQCASPWTPPKRTERGTQMSSSSVPEDTPRLAPLGGKETAVYQIEIAKQDSGTSRSRLLAEDL